MWDRHDLVFAYGPLDRLERALAARGMRPGAPAYPPSPHVHNYHPEWDAAEVALVGRLPWRVTPLRPGDEQ